MIHGIPPHYSLRLSTPDEPVVQQRLSLCPGDLGPGCGLCLRVRLSGLWGLVQFPRLLGVSWGGCAGRPSRSSWCGPGHEVDWMHSCPKPGIWIPAFAGRTVAHAGMTVTQESPQAGVQAPHPWVPACAGTTGWVVPHQEGVLRAGFMAVTRWVGYTRGWRGNGEEGRREPFPYTRSRHVRCAILARPVPRICGTFPRRRRLANTL